MRISDRSSDVCSSDLFSKGIKGSLISRPASSDGSQDPARLYRRPPATAPGGGPLPDRPPLHRPDRGGSGPRSEEHTSELQSLMRISYAVFCLKKKKHKQINTTIQPITKLRKTTKKCINNTLQ